MGGCADVAGGIVEDEVFEVNKFAVDPQRGAGVGKLGSFEEARADRRTGDALVQTRERESARAASKAGRVRAVMLIFVRS